MLAKKGGVGKTTLGLLLHEAFRNAGKSVAVRDWDAQGTSSKALRAFGGNAAEVDENYDVLIFDTPPNLEHTATVYAVQQADLILVLTSPSPADLWEADETAHFASQKNATASIRLVFNRVRKGTRLARLIPQSAEGIRVPALEPFISYRECYQAALGSGWRALDGPAREEVLQVTVALLSLGT